MMIASGRSREDEENNPFLKNWPTFPLGVSAVSAMAAATGGFGIAGHKNVYSTGVRCGNWNEDTIGARIAGGVAVAAAGADDGGRFLSETAAAHIAPRRMDDAAVRSCPPMLSAEDMKTRSEGMPAHLLFGHGFGAHDPEAGAADTYASMSQVCECAGGAARGGGAKRCICVGGGTRGEDRGRVVGGGGAVTSGGLRRWAQVLFSAAKTKTSAIIDASRDGESADVVASVSRKDKMREKRIVDEKGARVRWRAGTGGGRDARSVCARECRRRPSAAARRTRACGQ